MIRRNASRNTGRPSSLQWQGHRLRHHCWWCLCSCMIPFSRGNIDHGERLLNYRLLVSRVRRLVENAFGIMDNRFQSLLSTLKQRPGNIESIILVCVYLHNIMDQISWRSESPTHPWPMVRWDQLWWHRPNTMWKQHKYCSQAAAASPEAMQCYASVAGSVLNSTSIGVCTLNCRWVKVKVWFQ